MNINPNHKWGRETPGIEQREKFLTIRRMGNYLLNRRENNHGKIVLKSYPLFIYADLTSRCNLSCRMCEQNYIKKRGRDMTLESFHKLSPILDRALILFMHCTGEPLMNKNFLEIFKLAKSKGVLIAFSTNGMLFNQALAEELVGGGLNFLNFSIDSTDPQQFSDIRGGAKLDRVLRSIDMLNEAKRKLNKRNPLMGIAFCAMNSNIHHLPQVIELAGSKDLFSVTARNVVFTEVIKDEEIFRKEDITKNQKRTEEIGRAAQKKAKELGIMLRLDQVFSPNRSRNTGHRGGGGPLCSEPWQGLFMNVDGTVRPCCLSPHFMGDLNSSGFEEIWNAGEYRNFRKLLRQGDLPESCSFCSTQWFRDRADAYHTSFFSLLKQGQFIRFGKAVREIMG